MKIVFIDAFIELAVRNFKIGEELEKSGIEVEYITYSKESSDFFKKKNKKQLYLPDIFKNHKLVRKTDLYLEHFERKYNIPSVSIFLHTDIEHMYWGERTAKTALVKHFIFWENYLKNNKVDLIIGGVERFINNVPFYVSKKFKTKHLCYSIAPLIDGYHILSEDIYGHFDSLDKYWKKYKNKKLNKEEIEEVNKYIEEITSKKQGSYLGRGTNPTVNKENLKYFLKRLKLYLFVEKRRNPYGQFLRISKLEFLRMIRTPFEKWFYSEPKANERYILYPLHVENDSQLIVKAHHYSNQIPLIEVISRCLPYGYKLYVKGHPNNIGGVPFKILKRIKEIPNVKLISPKKNSHDLIKKSSAVAAINSTVGFESMLYQKPILNFGTVFYDICNEVQKVRNLYELPEIIKNSLNKEIKKEEIYRFIHAYLKTSKPGHILVGKKYMEKTLKKENIKLLAQAIIEKGKDI